MATDIRLKLSEQAEGRASSIRILEDMRRQVRDMSGLLPAFGVNTATLRQITRIEDEIEKTIAMIRTAER